MRHLKAWTIGALIGAVAIGCGPGKELPDDVPGPKTLEPKPIDPKESVPDKSDPAATAIVDRAVQAMTQNSPQHLAKGRSSTSTSTGTIKTSPDQGATLVHVQAVRTITAAWPDRIKVTYQYKSDIVGTDTLVFRRPLMWFGRDTTPKGIPQPTVFEDAMLTDGLAQHGMPLLFPLAEPGAIAFDARKAAGTPPADTIRFSLPERPVYQLSFDPATGHLTRVEYTHVEMEVRVAKLWAFTDRKAFDGLLLPTRVEYTHTPERTKGEVVQHWTVEKWEFPAKLDDAAFDPPK